jgi:predicted nucleic acid-binding protein
LESFAKIARNGIRYRKLYTSDYVLDEAITTCRRRTGSHELSVRLGMDILSSKSIVMLRVDENTIQESWELYRQRDDVKLSFTDATCVILAKAHGITSIFTYDARDFRPLNLNVISSL